MPIDEIRDTKIQKVEELRKLGIDPYPAKSNRTHTVAEAISNFGSLSDEKKTIVIAGRLMAVRGHGGAAFLDVYDNGSKIQGHIKKDVLGEDAFNKFQRFIDIGDFIEIKGTLFRTKKEEQTLEVEECRLLSKAILTLPEKWHGLQDEEDKLRKRYLDILFDPETREMFVKRSKFWQSTREFLLNRGFLEVETPVLESTTGGADAKPFITHHNALDLDVYLRISMGELWQKKLMVAGYAKTFEIGRQFRNEGMDSEHAQDYTQMEFYWAYADYNDGMELVEEMYKYVAKETFGTLQFKIKDFEIDLGREWERYDYRETIKKFTGVDILSAKLEEVEAKLIELKIKYDRKGFNITRALDNLWKYCRKQITGPGFLVGVPVALSPLAKRDQNNSELSQRFQVIIAGSEVGNGYSELNDPIDQANRFEDQVKLRESGDEEAQMYDYDFVEALEYGMPPTCGFGVSERLFSFLMNKSIRECQIFPLMKSNSRKG
ncbi:MAG: lysyl-tRNA synthetase [Candidatus Yanofskybacteria bacterium GW2011_GWE1_40_10]|nr:MAG: lysyl-tRNA synthetase [Candidatus Yanofskybacteria bacterium GW2011_GWE1_40_10]